MHDLFVRIVRKKASYQYKKFPNKPDDWYNNDANNMLDDFILFYNEALLFKAKCQSVSNIPGGRFKDTIIPSRFQIKCFVENRKFYGKIHGIINAVDLDGQKIDENSVTPIKGENGAPIDMNRTLIHDTQSLRPKPPMTLTRVAWSASCIILHPSDLEAIGKILEAYKVEPGDIIEAELIEDDK